MVTSMRSLAFVANLDGLKFLLDSGTVDFLIVSWLLGDGGGGSYRQRLIVALSSVAHYSQHDQEFQSLAIEQELKVVGPRLKMQALP